LIGKQRECATSGKFRLSGRYTEKEARFAMNHVPTLETDRLILRRLELTDAPRVQEYAGAREVAEMTLLIPHPYPDGAAEEFIRSTWESAKEGRGFTFAVTHKDTAELVGTISIRPEKTNNRGEIGYWIGIPHWGNGYATEATKAMIQLGFDTLGLNRIYAGYLTKNPASRRVQEKAGMTFEGVRRQEILKWGVYEDHGMCAILREEYFGRK
jgi:[ribosomal protein S5]-alanine N-acetyltransferase